MQRHAMIIGIKEEYIEEYKKYHANTWPEIEEFRPRKSSIGVISGA